MKKTLIMALVATASTAGAADAQWRTALPAVQLDDFTHKAAPALVNQNREPIQFSYALAADAALDFTPRPYVEESRQYWFDASGEELSQGVKLALSSSEAVIRISPMSLQDKAVEISAPMLQMSMAGEPIEARVFADSASLKATGAAFSDHTIAFKIDNHPGTLDLKVNGLTGGDAPFVVHVLEPKSSHVFELTTQRAVQKSGAAMTVFTAMHSDGGLLDASVQGYVSKPDGSVVSTLDFKRRADGRFAAVLDLPAGESLAHGLWQIHTYAEAMNGGVKVLRDAQSGFAVTHNSAAFNGRLALEQQQLSIGITASLAGRYEVKGVLYGHDSSGQARPLAMLMSANWLQAGDHNIPLALDQNLITQSGLNAPFELRNVQLFNQSLMAPVQTVEQGIAINALPLAEAHRR